MSWHWESSTVTGERQGVCDTCGCFATGRRPDCIHQRSVGRAYGGGATGIVLTDGARKGQTGCPGPSGVYGGSPACRHEQPAPVSECPDSATCPMLGRNTPASERRGMVGVRTGADGRPVYVLSDGPREPDAAAVMVERALTRAANEQFLRVANAPADGRA